MTTEGSKAATDLSIRRFESGDGDRVRELAVEAMATTPEFVPDAPDDDLRDVPGHYFDRGGEFLVGIAEGAIVATAAYGPLDGWMAEQFRDVAAPTVEVSRMRVDPDRQGEGIGTEMYAELERRARADGYDSFVLNTGAENDRAREFYESREFDPLGVETVDFDGVTLDLALYRKPFS